MEDDNKFSLNNYSKKITKEPPTYSIFLEKRKHSLLNLKDLNDPYLNSHTIIKESKSTADQLLNYLVLSGYNLNEIKLFDVGCGLGYITNEFAKKIGFNNVYCSDPSPSAKEFIKLEFANLNFIYSDIQNISDQFINFFDIIYLREVYPFTRTNNIDLHKKLLKKLLNLTKKNGLVVLEQIKGDKNILNNMKKLEYKFKIKRVIPNRLFKNKLFIYILNLNHTFVHFILYILYAITRRKVRYYISIKKN
tara:strand:- start:7249 stop:7995 length:747 start_codon:yes stop_codon:yes gene_type:complete